MKERPIIFNAEMVRAVLDGRKTQTRRIMKDQPEVIPKEDEFGEPGFWIPFNAGKTMVRNGDMNIACPFGAVGDRLWVRETFQGPLFDTVHIDAYLRDSEPFEKPEFCKYAADGGPRPEFFDFDDNLRYAWKPSIHMPRWASRITLEITGVRVERLKDVSESDAQAEGVQQLSGGFWRHYQPGWTQHQLSARGSFLTLWDSIYGADSWQANPWVWVIEFKRVEGVHVQTS